MQFILLNCVPKLQALGIDPSVNGWQSLLDTKLKDYMTTEGWSYDYSTGTLIVTPVDGTTVSLNITDLGDAGGVQL